MNSGWARIAVMAGAMVTGPALQNICERPRYVSLTCLYCHGNIAYARGDRNG